MELVHNQQVIAHGKDTLDLALTSTDPKVN